MSELSGRVRGVVNTPTTSSASGRWSVRAVAKYVAENVWPRISVPYGDYEPISAITVPSGGATSITFNAIPQTFQHLQIRLVSRTTQNTGSSYSNINMRVNGDSGANYSIHYLQGDGTSLYAGGSGSNTSINQVFGANSLSNANVFGANIIDILDYANTSKNTVFRIFHGYENNGSGSTFSRGFPGITSGAWYNTAAVTSIAFTVTSFAHAQHTTAALYGVKAP